MRNFKPPTKNCFTFHKDMISSKKERVTNKGIKSRISSLNTIVELELDEYNLKFRANNLESSRPYKFTASEHEDLLSLYSYKSKLIQSLKNEITTTDTNRIINTCQNCTIGEVNCFDHLLPKEEFCAFAVNPLNLFPSCSICNSAKGKYWLISNKRKFLNLYLDILPRVQYLFVDVLLEDNAFILKFEINNKNNVDSDLFNIIESHYSSLKLCERFSLNADKVISPLINIVETYLKVLPIDKIIESTIENANKNRENLGYNFWQSVAEIELIQNKDFLNYVQKSLIRK